MTSQEIKQVRIALGMSQQQFATKLGVGMMTVSRWERGKTEPSPLALEKLKTLVVTQRPTLVTPFTKERQIRHGKAV